MARRDDELLERVRRRPAQPLEQAQAAKLERVAALLDWSAARRRGCSRSAAAGARWRCIAPAATARRRRRHAVHRAAARARRRLATTPASPAARPAPAGLPRRPTARSTRSSPSRCSRRSGEYWPRYFQTLRAASSRAARAWSRPSRSAMRCSRSYRHRADFIQRYVFPGGMLPSPAALHPRPRGPACVRTALTFGDGYAATLVEWRRRFPGVAADRGARLRRTVPPPVGVLPLLLRGGVPHRAGRRRPVQDRARVRRETELAADQARASASAIFSICVRRVGRACQRATPAGAGAEGAAGARLTRRRGASVGDPKRAFQRTRRGEHRSASRRKRMPSNATARAVGWVEQGLVPDRVVRLGIRRLLKERLAEMRDATLRRRRADAGLRRRPARGAARAAARQGQRAALRAARRVLRRRAGPHRKYSSCWWPEGVERSTKPRPRRSTRPASAPSSSTARTSSSSVAAGDR